MSFAQEFKLSEMIDSLLQKYTVRLLTGCAQRVEFNHYEIRSEIMHRSNVNQIRRNLLGSIYNSEMQHARARLNFC